MGFVPFWRIRGGRRRRRNGGLCLKLSGSDLGESDESGLGLGAGSRDRDYDYDYDDDDRIQSSGIKKGLILGTERDGSGSVVGFQLIPPAGIFLQYIPYSKM